MDQFTKKQPDDGDNVLHCGHLDSHECHFFYAPNGISYMRPGGTEMETANWVVGCKTCLDKVNFDASRMAIRGSATWSGSEPAVVVNPKRPPEYPAPRRRRARVR